MPFPLPSSPTRTPPSIDNSRNGSSLAGTSLSQLGSDNVISQFTDFQDDSLSEFGREAGGPFDPRQSSTKSPNGMESASNDHPALQPSPAKEPISERSEGNLSRTKRRLRSNDRLASKTQPDHSREDYDTSIKTKKGTKRKASASPETSVAADRTSPGPLVALVNQIGRNNTIADIRENVQELKASPYRARALAESLHRKQLIQIGTSPARIIQATPNLAREIEHSTFNEQVSRIYYRIAIANFYCAYRAAHANPYVFLQELDRHPSQQTPQSQTRNRTKRAEIKDRFIQLVFSQWTNKRNHKKDSTRVNNWQSAGRPWFELIDRFGTGILLLVPEGVTNCRQVFHFNTWLLRRAM